MTRITLFLLLALVAFALDQATKAAALYALDLHQPVPIFPGFNLTLGFNTGASFGMLSDLMADTPLIMAALTGLITLGLAWLGLRAGRAWETAGFALIVGGSSGNIFDRLRQGAVTDFLDFYWRDWHWPTFNGADIAIFLGVAAILLAGLSHKKETGHA
ncbi:signal peptidase II [Pseudogemmobacter bohemicus]|uniref:signal peptidase II n=1 Tax=Pseudogemmobacter bohemicus TaxID=2250708 RepID=UPI000DD41B47|nr:signal peptidase II [Pseudogemmobacter bohemicus]